jgi:RNA polymerase sigma-70 factor, ECF subfamily
MLLLGGGPARWPQQVGDTMGGTTIRDRGLPDRPTGTLSTVDLLERFKQGDEEAVDQLVERSIPPLRRWARGRLPQWARSLEETQDVVQHAVLCALPRLKTFTARHPGALQAYLRRAVDNHIKDEIRKVKVRPALAELPDDQPDEGPSQVEFLSRQELVERYRAALKTLRVADRQVIIARVERQQDYDEIAASCGKPSVDAARMAVARALKNLLNAMSEQSCRSATLRSSSRRR